MKSESPQSAPSSEALLEKPPAAEPSIVAADEHRDPPVPDPLVVNTSRPPTPEVARLAPTPTPARLTPPPEAVRPTPAPTPARPVPPPEAARPTPAPKLPAVAVPREEGRSARFVGALQIDSTPRGARVFIDRREVGVTPVVLTGLVVGSHVVRLEADGHATWSSAIRVIADRQTDVRTKLAPSLENE